MLPKILKERLFVYTHFRSTADWLLEWYTLIGRPPGHEASTSAR